MGASEQTPNIGLPHFVDGDKPTWRGDINGAFTDIDTEFGNYRLSVFDVRAYGTLDLTGVVDSSAAVIAAIAAANAAGGGVVYFPNGTIRIDSQIVIPLTGGVKQNPITLRGAGMRGDGLYGVVANIIGGTLLDLRYTGAGGKISSTGWVSLTYRT